jgi:hypothetical protein
MIIRTATFEARREVSINRSMRGNRWSCTAPIAIAYQKSTPCCTMPILSSINNSWLKGNSNALLSALPRITHTIPKILTHKTCPCILPISRNILGPACAVTRIRTSLSQPKIAMHFAASHAASACMRCVTIADIATGMCAWLELAC